MTLDDLDHEQKLALVALLELFAMADNSITEHEEAEISTVADHFGNETYRALLDEVDERFPNEQRLQSFLETIREQAAQELIYGMVMEESMNAPTIHPRTDFLDWLRSTWNIEVREEELG